MAKHKPEPKTSGVSGKKSRSVAADSKARAAASVLAQLDNDARKAASKAADQAAKDAAAKEKP